jgi:hypothetical protein
MDFSHVFILFEKGKRREVGLARDEIEANWERSKGNVEETLQKRSKSSLPNFNASCSPAERINDTSS